MIRFLAISLIAILIPSCVQSGIVHNDRGGYLTDYLERRDSLISSGVPVQFSGYANSAATALLSVPGSCAHHGATFGFHGAFVGSVHDPIGTMLLANTYPISLQTWFYTSGASQMIGDDMLTLTAADLVGMGVIDFCEVQS